MSTALLIITHNGIGQALIKTATSMLGEKASQLTCISIPANLQPQDLGYYADQIRNCMTELNSGEGVLILTDIYGATPSNLASYFGSDENVNIISGLNLPMLIRVLNYRQRPLQQLAVIAVEGGHKGIQQGS